MLLTQIFFFLNYEACITSLYLEHTQCLDLILFLLWGTSKETFQSSEQNGMHPQYQQKMQNTENVDDFVTWVIFP